MKSWSSRAAVTCLSLLRTSASACSPAPSAYSAATICSNTTVRFMQFNQLVHTHTSRDASLPECLSLTSPSDTDLECQPKHSYTATLLHCTDCMHTKPCTWHLQSYICKLHCQTHIPGACLEFDIAGSELVMYICYSSSPTNFSSHTSFSRTFLCHGRACGALHRSTDMRPSLTALSTLAATPFCSSACEDRSSTWKQHANTCHADHRNAGTEAALGNSAPTHGILIIRMRAQKQHLERACQHMTRIRECCPHKPCPSVTALNIYTPTGEPAWEGC